MKFRMLAIIAAQFSAAAAFSAPLLTKTITVPGYVTTSCGLKDGGFLVVAKVPAGTGWNIALNDFDATGNPRWSRILSAPASEVGMSVLETLDGGLAIAGSSQDGGYPGPQSVLIKTDSQGELLFRNAYGSAELGIPGYPEADPSFYRNWVFDMVPTADSGFVLAGQENVNSYYNPGFLLKLDKSGQRVWVTKFSDNGSGDCRTLKNTPDGGFIVAGEIWGYPYMRFTLFKTDANGTEAWRNSIPSTDYRYAYDIELSNKGFMVIGSAKPGQKDYYQAWTLSADHSGNALSERFFGDSTKFTSGLSLLPVNGGWLATSSDNFNEANITKLGPEGRVAWSLPLGSVYDAGLKYPVIPLGRGKFVTCSADCLIYEE